MKKYLNEIPALSVREDSGVEIINQSTGRVVPQVLDPALLVEKSFGEQIVQFISIKNIVDVPYMVCYFLSSAKNYYEVFKELSRVHKLEIIWITSEKPMSDKPYRQYDASPLEFVKLIQNTIFVCMDSLHGAEFSVVMNTPFV